MAVATKRRKGGNNMKSLLSMLTIICLIASTISSPFTAVKSEIPKIRYSTGLQVEPRQVALPEKEPEPVYPVIPGPFPEIPDPPKPPVPPDPPTPVEPDPPTPIACPVELFYPDGVPGA